MAKASSENISGSNNRRRINNQLAGGEKQSEEKSGIIKRGIISPASASIGEGSGIGENRNGEGVCIGVA